jgi:hypothetical protein
MELPDHSGTRYEWVRSHVPSKDDPDTILVTFSKEPKKPPSVNKGTIGKLLKQWKKKKERHATPESKVN